MIKYFVHLPVLGVLELSIISFGCQNVNMKLTSHQYRAWLECIEVQPDLPYTGGKG